MCPGDQQILEKCMNEQIALGEDAEACKGQLFACSTVYSAHSSRPLS